MIPGVMEHHRRNEDKVPGVQVVDAFVDQDPAFAAVDVEQLIAAVAVVAGHDKAGIAQVRFRVDTIRAIHIGRNAVRHFFLLRYC